MAVGELIQRYRKARRISQLDLALEADVSTRHISFMETGRSAPSREMLLKLAFSMDLSLREANLLLVAAGMQPQFGHTDLTEPGLALVKEALEFVLESHEPYPAVVMDHNWNILMANRIHLHLIEMMVAVLGALPETTNILELLFDPKGFKFFVKNWDEVACFLLRKRAKEELLMSVSEEGSLLQRLLQYPGIPHGWKSDMTPSEELPMVPLHLEIGELNLTMFSTIATFGTPVDVTMQELRLENYFPADDESKAYFKSL